MSNKLIKINNWPFDKEEKAKLIWIGEPFRENKKWVIHAYFKSNGVTKGIKMDWATIHFLSVNKMYKNGLLNKTDIPKNTKIIELNLDGIEAKYNERDWKIQGTEIETKSKTFNFSKDGKVYTIPIIEIIRTVLAPDRFMLNLILSMDTIDNFFTYEISDNTLDIYFTSEYEKRLLSNEKINHLAWILANREVLKMLWDISNNISQLDKGELKFNFLLNNFRIKARVEEKGPIIKIQEILAVRYKNLNLAEINVYHPSLERLIDGNQTKKREFIAKSSDANRELTNEADGSKDESEFIETNIVEYGYTQTAKITKKTVGRTQRRNYSDGDTKQYLGEDSQKRTLSDACGENRLKGLEFYNLSDVKIQGELEEFIEILKLLERRGTILKVEITVDFLPDFNGYKFAKLSDGFTRRRYAIGKIIMKDGRVNSLIEIERQVKSLSMLLLIQANKKVDFEWVYNGILEGLVKKSGNWNNEVINHVQKMGTSIIRIKHLKNSVYEKEDNIYRKIIP